MKYKHIILILIIILSDLFPLYGQEAKERYDTIPAARKIADREIPLKAGSRHIKSVDFHTMVSATGTPDVVKYIQTTPGISTGAEGSSAYYARGGNLGNNLISIDGVPIYGSGHLLGFTSVYPGDLVSDAVFRIGGFSSDESNMTASHVGITTKDGLYDNDSLAFSASPFLMSGMYMYPIVKEKFSVIGSVRVSPVGPEFNLLKKLSSAADSIGRTQAIVYDAFVKGVWRIDNRNTMSMSLFRSLDTYKVGYGSNSDDHLRWDNLILNVRLHSFAFREWEFDNALSFNMFSNRQGMAKVLGESHNDLMIVNNLKEFMVKSSARIKVGQSQFQTGVILRNASFNPGSSSYFSGGRNSLMMYRSDLVKDIHTSMTATYHAQWELDIEDRFEFRAAGRLNYNHSVRRNDRSDINSSFDPEADLFARLYFTGQMGIEATADWTTQYYHTLEGVPLGWSVDMMVPFGKFCPPERATQYYAGAFVSLAGHHYLSGGVYWKEMDNLVYYRDAVMLFSSATAGWKDGIDIGTGTSRGVEFLYEMSYENVKSKIAYTWSKTDRNFPGVNRGQTFHAKFDRNHILNTTTEWTVLKDCCKEVGLSTLLTFQSGHWETISPGTYEGALLLGPVVEINYFDTINNYKMPDYFRWDAGAFFRFGRHHRQELTLGIYNITNRHNPFVVVYDDTDKEWKQISLFPIMPSISYSIEL